MDDQQQLSDKDVNAVFQKSAEQEAAAYELFSNRFDQQFPMPEKAAVKLMNAIGWQFVSICIQSVFAILLAALRTADMFYDAASGTNTWIQGFEAFAAIGAIELGVVIFATIKSEIENSKSSGDIEELKQALKINVKLLWTGIIACVVISIVAGLGVSFKGFGIEWAGFKWIIAIAMGAGASLVAWVSGDILGAMLARWNNAAALANALYAKELDEREAKKRDMWEAAPERQIARSELAELKEYLAATRFKASRQPKVAPQSAPTPPLPQPLPRKTGTRNNEVRMRVYSALDANWDQFHDIQVLPTPSKLREELGISKGYASDVIKAWKTERGILTSETPEDENAPQ